MSLRARLLVAMGAVALVLLAASVVITRTTSAHLVEQVDAQLATAGRPLERGRPDDGQGAGFRPLNPLFVGRVDAESGAVAVVTTPNFGDETPPLPTFTAEQLRQAADSGEPFTTGSDGSDLRYRAVVAAGPLRRATVLALPLGDVDEAVRRLVVLELAVTAVVLAVLALVTWWVVRLGVRPIKQMTATATAIAGGELSHRVPDVVHGSEAGELGHALNQMLGRIEEAFDERERSQGRLRAFVGDASHELRTPITTIRGYAELYRSGGLGAGDQLDEAMRRTEQEAVRMGTLVDDMLHLARLDQGRPLLREQVDLSALAQDAVRDARAVDPSRPIEAVTGGPVVVTGDEGRLRQVVANLVGNAVVHTEPDVPVEVRVGAADGMAWLEVADQGAGMAPEMAQRAFERFSRADASRSRHRGGSGLGLSIVEATVAAHGGRSSLASTVGQGTTARVELPVDGPTPALPIA